MKRKPLLFLLLMALFAPLAMMGQQTTLTVYDGTKTNYYVPAYMGYFDEFTRSQYVIPATALESLGDGAVISSLKFYSNSSNVPYPGTGVTPAPVVVYLKEVSYTSISAFEATASASTVYTGTLAVVTEGNGGSMTIDFDTPFIYHNGNLLVGIENTDDADYEYIYFYGQTVTGASVAGSNGSSLSGVSPTQRNFIPKTTFTYTPGTISSCPRPTNLVVSNVTNNSAVLTWKPGGDETEWMVEYKTADATSWTLVPGTVSDTTYTLTDLASATGYEARVQASCNEGKYVSTSFTTKCNPNTTFPWSEDFEGYSAGNFVDPCWVNEHISGGGTQIFKIYASTTGTNTTKQLQLPDMTSGTMTKLVLPGMTIPTGVVHEFDIDVYRNSSSSNYGEGIRVYASTNGEIEGATELAFISRSYKTVYAVDDDTIIPAESGSGWYTYKLPIPFTGTCYIILRGESKYGSATYMDNFVIREKPTCILPTALAASEETGTTAKLTWTANGDEAAWDIYYSTTATAPTSETTPSLTAVDTIPYTLTELTPSTMYYAWVRANCGGSVSDWSASCSFATACTAVTDFPWNDDFESYSEGDFIAPCWVNERIQDGTGSGSLYIFKITTYTYTGNSTKILQLPDMKAGTLTKLVFPEMTLPGDDYQFVLDVYRNTNSKPTEGIRVFVSTDGELAGATELAFISRDYTVSDNGLIPAETASGWYTYELPLGISGTCYIILRGESQYGSATYMDNFAVEQIPTCARPSNLTCSAKTAHTATLAWTNGAEGQNAWQIAYSTNANFNPDEVTPVDVTHNPDTLTGLDANTTYYAYVRANCGNNDYSPWCRTYVTFKTNVGNATPTLTVDQSSITYNSAKVTWTAVATNELHESYELYYSQLSTRPDPLQNDSLITGITDLNYVFTRLNPETKYYVWLRDNCGTDGLSNWSSSKNFTTLSACVAPNNLRCLNTTTSSATLSWFERGDATEWVLTYMTERDTIDVRVDENPYMLTGLADGTYYSVKVRPTCSETAWSSVVSFTTPALCPAPTNLTVYDITGHTATMNWVGTSNSYIVTWGINNPVEQLKVDFSDGIPTDWTNDTIYPWTVVDGYIKSGNAGEHNSTSAISLTMTFSVDGTIEFDAECMGEGTYTYWDHCDFYIDGTRKLYHGADLGSGWKHYSFDVTAGEHTFTWSYTKDSSQHPTGDYFAVDNVKVSLTNMVWDEPVTVQDTVYNFSGLSPETLYYVKLVGDCVSDSLSAEVNTTFTTTVACPAPTDLHYVDTTLTAHEVMLSWTETGLASEWQICVNNDMDNLIPADTTSYMLTNLDQDTDYSVKVRANCGDEDGTSTWSNVLTFHTLVTCAVPTNLAADNIATESATLTWEGTSDSYVVQYRPWLQVGDDQVSTAVMTTYTYDLSEYSGTGSIAIRHYDVTNMFYLNVDDIIVKNAQDEVVFSEDFEGDISTALSIMDLDGDGYNWEIGGDTYNVNGNYGIISASYNNTVGPLTPDNWLIISGVELGGQISFAAVGQDAEWASENFGVFVSPDDDFEEEIVEGETSIDLWDLTPNTPYAWQVKGVCDEDESQWAMSFFTTLDDAIVFTTDGDWNVASNWTPATVPTVENNVRIEADATIPAGVVAEANKVTIDGGSITIKDGGQLKQNSATLQVTMEKEIASYGEGNGNYYLISSPFSGRTLYSSTSTDWNHVDSLFNGSYDLYTFDPANGEDEEWVNFKEDPTHINYQSESQGNAGLLDKEGYLYANEDGVTLTFIGNISKNINITENKAIAYEANKGWALVGNIFACNAYLNFVDDEGEVLEANYWVMNAAGDDFELAETADGIAPITAAFVNFGADGYVQINSEEPTRYHRTGKFIMSLNQDGNNVDKAVVRFGKGLNLEKMSLKNNSKLYFSNNDKDYAVVYSLNSGNMPVNFKAETAGSYTINFAADGVSFKQLILIDNANGTKVDLLANPSYTFETEAGEFAKRFTIVYTTK